MNPQQILENLYSKRNKLQDEALAVLERFKSSKEVLSVYDWADLGHELFMLQLPVDAEEAYLKAIEAGKDLTDEDEKVMIVAYGDLAGVYEEMGEFSKAYEMVTKSINTRKKFYSDDNLFIKMNLERLRKLKIFMQYIPDKTIDELIRKEINSKS